MGTKKDIPPRPPAPKVSLDKQRSKQSSIGSMSISFKSLEEDDDDDELAIFKVNSSSSSTKLSELSKSKSVNQNLDSKWNKSRLHCSRSLDEDNLTSLTTPKATTVSKASPTVKEEKKTLLSGLRDKLSDTFPDTYNAIAKKLEEFSGENATNTDGDKKLGSSGKYEELSPISEKASLEEVDGKSSHPLLYVQETNLSDTTVDSSPEKAEDALETFSKSPAVDQLLLQGESLSDSMPVVEDFYVNEPYENFDGSIRISTIKNNDNILRSRSSLKNLIKPSKQNHPTTAPVSMSSLLTQSPSQDSTESNDTQNDDDTPNADEPEKVIIRIKSDIEKTSVNESTKSSSPSPGHPATQPVPIYRLLIASACLLVYLIIPLPSYLSGIVMGSALASACWMFYLWLTKPPVAFSPVKLESVDDMPPMIVPEMKEPKVDDGKYSGWANELMFYDPDNYHINQTHSVFIRLDGTSLRLSRPKTSIPKRSMWDDPTPTPSHFIHQRHYDLVDSRVMLLPAGLINKRVWSKKYPVCIALSKQGKKCASSDSSIALDNMGNQDIFYDTSANSSEELGFEVVTGQKCDNNVLFLFARTCREKEEWYYRFDAAARGTPLTNHIRDILRTVEFRPQHRRSSSDQALARHKRHSSADSASSSPILTSPMEEMRDDTFTLPSDTEAFALYMARLMPASRPSSHASTPTHHRHSDSRELKDAKEIFSRSISPLSISCDSQLTWLNALIGRLFWDFLWQNYWADKMKDKLQKKLSKIHVPYFIEELQITDIQMGTETPVIRRATKPYLDERGFWVDLDIAYGGGFRMTMETKLNLMKLKRTRAVATHHQSSVDGGRSAVTDSEEEDSAESSTDEEAEDTTSTHTDDAGGATGGGTGKKLLRYLDKFTQSKYFQQAAENRYIKKAMTEVSNTRLVLSVEVRSLVGTLAVNIPPPPSDRLWYGFHSNTRLWLVAKPKVGQREVTVTHVTDWIEKKLTLEFQRVFLLPNMDDLVIPLLMSGVVKNLPPKPSQPSTSSCHD